MWFRRSFVVTLFFLSLWALVQGPVQAAEQKKTYTFGVVPQQSASTLAEDWGPLIAAVSAETGIPIEFSTAPNIPTFEKRLSQGEYDFAYMNPYHYVVFSQHPGYRAIARSKGRMIHGIVVVRKDSPYRNIHELSGKTLAFPTATAFAASILVRAEFAHRGVKIKPKYVSSHDSVYLNVAKGLVPAGGGVLRTLHALDPEVRDQLRILWTTPGYTPHAIAVKPGTPENVVRAVQSALVHMDETKQGRELLKPLAIIGWQMAKDSDWDDVRQLDIRLLDNYLPE